MQNYEINSTYDGSANEGDNVALAGDYKNSDFRVMVDDFVDTFEKSKKKKAVKKKPEPTTLELFMGVTA